MGTELVSTEFSTVKSFTIESSEDRTSLIGDDSLGDLFLNATVSNQGITDLPSTETTNIVTISALERSCKEYKFVIIFIFGFFAFFGGIIGNVLSTVTFWPQRNRNSTSFLLITLSFYDTWVLIVFFINQSLPALCDYMSVFYPDYCDYYIRWVKPYFSVYLWHVGIVAHMAGTWNVFLVTFFRYVVCFSTCIFTYKLSIFANFANGVSIVKITP